MDRLHPLTETVLVVRMGSSMPPMFAVIRGTTGASCGDSEIEIDSTGVLELERHGNMLTFDERRLNAEEHQMISPRLQRDCLSGRDDEAVSEFAHVHNVIDHGHLMDLNFIGERRRATNQPIIGLAIVGDDEIAAACGLAWQRCPGKGAGEFEVSDMHGV